MTANFSIQAIAHAYQIPVQPAGHHWTLAESYQFCRALTVSHYENFPVGSRLLPKAKREHVYPIYAFARIADDFADEPRYEGCRLEWLHEWDARLLACVEGRAEDPVFIALADTLEKCLLPVSLFRDLLHAFKRDVTVSRYETWHELIHSYCRYSANPVGRLILHLFDYRDEERLAQSDKICTALQLANFWQDVSVDLQKDRVYIPIEAMQRHQYSLNDLQAHIYDTRLQNLMDELCQATWRHFQRGYPLLDSVRWPLNAELRFTWMGGVRILQQVMKNDYNVFQRPVHSKWHFARLAVRSLCNIDSAKRHYDEWFSQHRRGSSDLNQSQHPEGLEKIS